MEPIFAVLAALAVGTVVFLLSPGGQKARDRLEALAASETPRALLLEKSFLERGRTPFVRYLAEVASAITPEGQRARLVRSLQQAGFNRDGALEVLLAAKVAALMGAIAAGWLIGASTPAAGWLVGALCAAGGLLGPDIWLRSRIERRKAAIANSLPHVVDLLTACVEAGLGFDAALQQILPALGDADAPLKEELAWYLSDVGLGQPRQQALEDMAERCGVDELRGLVAAILQGDRLGQGIGMTLRAQSQHLRIRRRQRAQEEAMEAPVKMLVPLVFCIFPAMFVVILGPAALQLADVLGEMVRRAQ